MTLSLPDIDMTESDIPTDVAPPTVEDYDPEFPGSTEDAPYGYKPDGTPYKRRPKGSGTGTRKSVGKGNLPSSDKQAKTAAATLARLNVIVGLSLNTFGLRQTAESIMVANDQFESMAYEALLTDPALCRKILGAGTTGGKAGLVVAYGMLGMAILPTAKSEIAVRRAEREAEEYAAG